MRRVLWPVLMMLLLLASTAAFADPIAKQNLQRAYFAMGCFWKSQYVFGKVPGVVRTRVGYMGGNLSHPTYEQVCTDKTGHAETVLVEYDPSKTTYKDLLDYFFISHNPTTLNRQGPDTGTQYRSVIFYTTPEQKKLAEQYIEKLQRSHRYKATIVTEIKPAGQFYDAEEYHQDYYVKHGAVCN